MVRGQRLGQGQDGFAAVDALVAITILSVSLTLSLAAAQIGVRASRTAGETRNAELLLRDRLESTADQAGAWGGRIKGMTWRVEANVTGTDRPYRAAPCVRTARATGTSGRTYRVATVDICQSMIAP